MGQIKNIGVDIKLYKDKVSKYIHRIKNSEISPHYSGSSVTIYSLKNYIGSISTSFDNHNNQMVIALDSSFNGADRIMRRLEELIGEKFN